MTSCRRPCDRGFSLLEVVLGVTLLGLVALGFAFLATNAQRYLIQSMLVSGSQGEATIALEHIKRHLSAATEIHVPPIAPPPGSQSVVLEFTWQPRAGQAPRTSQYLLDGGTLWFVPDRALLPPGPVVPNPNRPDLFENIARGIQTLADRPPFTRNPAGRVTVDLTAEQTSADGEEVRRERLQTVISPRGIF